VAVYVNTLDDIMNNLEFLCECSEDLTELAGVIHDYRVTNPSIGGLEATQVIRNKMLGELTGCVVGTQTDVSCYPTGLLTAIFFDVDGNPL
jgi:hypothetical protein